MKNDKIMYDIYYLALYKYFKMYNENNFRIWFLIYFCKQISSVQFSYFHVQVFNNKLTKHYKKKVCVHTHIKDKLQFSKFVCFRVKRESSVQDLTSKAQLYTPQPIHTHTHTCINMSWFPTPETPFVSSSNSLYIHWPST